MIQELLHRVLIKDPILTKLKTLQKTLDEFDVEHIFQLYSTLKDQESADNIVHWESVITQYNERLSFSTDVLAAAAAKQKIFEYVLSMTFKDCSLMINVTPSANDASNKIKLTNNQAFEYDIKVIDIDLKNIAKIPYWYELDQSIVRYAKDTNFNKSNCLE
jgi:inositol-pentakisphosphate 2-kinase